MSISRIQQRIEEWIADQITKADPFDGDDWGYAATMIVAETPQGQAVSWRLLVTLRAPFLGQPIGASIGLKGDMPPEPAVRHFTSQMTSDLRQEFERRKTNMVKAPGLGLPGLPGMAGLPGVPKQGPN